MLNPLQQAVVYNPMSLREEGRLELIVNRFRFARVIILVGCCEHAYGGVKVRQDHIKNFIETRRAHPARPAQGYDD